MSEWRVIKKFFWVLILIGGLGISGLSAGLFTPKGFLRINYFTDDKSNGFLVSQMRLGLKGEISPKILLVNSLEFTNSDSVNSLLLYDAYVKMNLDLFSLRAGQYKYQFGQEQSTPEEDLELINKAKVVSNLLKPSRDIGIEFGRNFSGRFRPEISISLVNGEGSNKPEVNRDKTFIARLVVNPLKDVALGFSFYDGNISSPTVTNKDRQGIELKYERKPVLFKAEFLSGDDNFQKSCGYYLLAGYYLSPQILCLGRYELWDGNTEVSGDLLQGATIGLNYFLTENVWLRVNLENSYPENLPAAGQLISQIQVKF